MSIASAKITINGTQYTLTKGTGDVWTATVTAPGKTSYNETNHVYNCSVTATNTAGTSTTATGSDIEGLNLRVKETVKPTITIVSPTSGAYVSNNKQPVVFQVKDETNGSGINISTVDVKLDTVSVASSTLAKTTITNGYQYTYTPASAMSDGSHSVAIDVSDNDGNAAIQASVTFKVDTVPPTLTITSPTDDLITSSASIAVSGTTNDATSSPVTITINLNGTDQDSVSVSANGSFTKTVILAEGSNTIVVTATDAAGKTSSVTRSVTLDTSAPEIAAVTITPNPADAGATLSISVTITG